MDIGKTKAVYPDMKLYEEIIFLKHFTKCKYSVENVVSYYDPLIRPQLSGRHYFWTNFRILNRQFPASLIKGNGIEDFEKDLGFSLQEYNVSNKRKILRNCARPELGLHIFNCAFKEKQEVLV